MASTSIPVDPLGQRVLVAWIRTNEFPCALDRSLLLGLGGAALFAAAWLWSLASSLQLRRKSRAHEQRDRVERSHQ